MRWPKKVPIIPNEGEKRVVTRFALFPITIRNERVWLEFYQKTQEYQDRWLDGVGWWDIRE